MEMNKLFKRLLVCIMILTMCSGIINFPVYAAGGTIGSITWSYDNNVLTISGKGKMQHFSYDEPSPWYKYRNKAKKIVVDDGITRIGDLAFCNFVNVTEVSLPGTLKTIGFRAFYDCGENTEGIESFSLPYSVTSLGDCAVGGRIKYLSVDMENIPGNAFACSIGKLDLGGNVRTIEELAFAGTGLSSVTIPETVSSIGGHAFGFEVYEDEDDESVWTEYIKDENFKMYVYPDTCGYTYAIDNDFKCVVIDTAEFVTQPKDINAVAGIEVSNTVKASCAASYRWWYKDSTGWHKVPGSFTGYNKRKLVFTTTAEMDGWKFLCKVRSTNGEYVNSNIVKITILKPANILIQPKSASAAAGTFALFALKAENAAGYRWQYNSGSGWKNVPTTFTGYNTRKLTVKALAKRNGWLFRCRIKGKDDSWITSKKVKLTVG